MEQTNATGAEQEVSLFEESSLKNMTTWYDQQIVLATKSRELALIKADIARSRLDETLAMVKIAELTVGLPADQPTNAEEKSPTPGQLRPIKPGECSQSE